MGRRRVKDLKKELGENMKESDEMDEREKTAQERQGNEREVVK